MIEPTALEPGTALDRYTVEGVLGRGGMAVVYRARHNQLGTAHAIKVLTISSSGLRQRLLQEGRVQAQLEHPNIVRVTDVVDVHGAPGLVMELVRGPSLDRLLLDQRLSLEQVDALAEGILAGVLAAHRQGLVHRDLKPANVMVAISEHGITAKVTDFGLAKIIAGEPTNSVHTRSGMTMGTPAYMAPEQIRNAKHADHRADIFALGAILYEMVTGAMAFPGNDLLEVFTAVGAGRYVPVRELAPDVPERMERAIRGALTVDLGARLQDCEALLGEWRGTRRASASSGPFDVAMLGARYSDAGQSSASDSFPVSTMNNGSAPTRGATVDWEGGPPGSGEQDSRARANPQRSSAPPTVAQTGEGRAQPRTVASSEADATPRASPGSALAKVVAFLGASTLLVAVGAGGAVAVGVAAWVLLDPSGASAVVEEADAPGEVPEAPVPPVEEPVEVVGGATNEEGGSAETAGRAAPSRPAPRPEEIAAAPAPVETSPPEASPPEPSLPEPSPPEASLPEPSPSPTEAAVAPPKPAPSAGRVAPPGTTWVLVAVKGDPARVTLIAQDGTRSPIPGAVAPGTYTVEAIFEDQTTAEGRVTLVGTDAVVSCRRGVRVCR